MSADARPPTARRPVRLRKAATPADWAAVRELCCLTAQAGDPIERSRWPLFGELWIGPYQCLLPGWTYVAEIDGRVVGYLTGCPDTAAFQEARCRRVTLPLLLRVLSGRYGWSADARRFVGRALRCDRGPEARLAERMPVALPGAYPAHLHMNVAAAHRGDGIGGRLIERYTEDLQAAGVPAIHLFCGARARTFYLRHGFTELGAVQAGPDRWVYALGRRLTARAG